MDIVIVESPAKAKTINQYLGKIIVFLLQLDMLEILKKKKELFQRITFLWIMNLTKIQRVLMK